MQVKQFIDDLKKQAGQKGSVQVQPRENPGTRMQSTDHPQQESSQYGPQKSRARPEPGPTRELRQDKTPHLQQQRADNIR